MVNIAMVGRWHVHYANFQREILGMDNAKITVVWDEDERAGQAWADELGIDFEPDFAALLERGDVDALVFAAANRLHEGLMVRAARAKKHLFSEKVLAPTLKEGAAIAKAVSDNGVKFSMNFYYETYPHALLARRICDQKLLGEITYIRYRVAHNGCNVIPSFVPEDYFVEARSGGGALIDIGAHSVNMLGWFGDEPESVASLFVRHTGVPLEDNAVSLVRFRSGAIGVAEASFLNGQGRLDILEVFGTKGMLRINVTDAQNERGGAIVRAAMRDDSHHDGEWVDLDDIPQAKESIISQWVDAIKKDLPADYGMDRAIRLTEIMDAAYRSHREGRTVFIDDLRKQAYSNSKL